MLYRLIRSIYKWIYKVSRYNININNELQLWMYKFKHLTATGVNKEMKISPRAAHARILKHVANYSHI